jgi:hypothetical protein
MSKLYKAKIDVKKIKKELLYVGAKCTYLDIDIWILDKPDQFGNDISIQQQTKKDEPKIYLGQGKEKIFEKKDSGPVAREDFQGGKKATGAMSDVADLGKTIDGPENNELSDLPF